MLPKILETRINEFLFVNYGIEGSLRRLGGENLNLLIATEQGERYVLKIVTEESANDSAPAEDRLFQHLKRAGFSRDLPTIIKTYKGNINSGIKIHNNELKLAYLMNYVPGEVLEKKTDISDKLRLDTGRAMASLDCALRGFDDPFAHRKHQWELPQAGRHRDKIAAIEDPSDRALVEWAYGHWESVSHHLTELPHQVIHGDANKENLLAKGDRVTGLVDFADVCFNPRICELAVLLTYMMMGQADPMEAASSVIRGYSEVIELQERELDVLFPLVCVRLAVSVCMASMRLAEDPENPSWFVSLEPALDLLRRLRRVGTAPADAVT